MKIRRTGRRTALVLAVVLIVLGVLNGLFISRFFVTEEYDSSVTVDREARVLFSTEDEVEVLVLSDLQFSNYIEMSWAFATAKRTVAAARPDLILTTGDNFGNDVSLRHLRAFVRFMDSFGIPWGVTFGNHDYNASFSMEEYAAACEGSENGIFYTTKIEGSYSNYAYRLNIAGTDAFSLICMDTKGGELSTAHSEWYEASVLANTDEMGKALPSFVFFHIPLPESALAEAYAADPTIGEGNIVDEVRTHGTGSGLFERAVALGSTRAFFYGHDHRNNAHITYRGIRLCYAMKTGRTVYYERGSLGGVLITLSKDGEYEIERIFVK